MIMLTLMLLTGLAGAQEPSTAFVHARIVDGRGGPPLENATLLVQGKRITAVGAGVAVPRGARRVECAGRTLLPGLISDHSHVGQVQGVQNGAAFYTRDNVRRELAQFSRYGVTTVTALGNNAPLFGELRREAHRGLLGGSDLLGVEQGIGVPQGAPPQDMLKVGPDQLFRPATPEAARRAVGLMASRHTDLVKLWLDDFGGKLPVKMKPAVYRAVIEESHRRGLRVAAHVHDLEDAEAIVAAGADILAHGVRDQTVPAALIERLKRKKIWYIATLQLDDAAVAWADQASWSRAPWVQKGLSAPLRRQFASPAWRARTRSGAQADAARRSLEFNLKNLKLLFDAGVPLGFGTDSGATPLRVPGVAEHRELELMVQAGLTPLQALSVATRGAANLMHLSDRGVLAAGKRADLLLVQGDPSTDIQNVHQVVGVWMQGKAVKL